jgi:hypothetical protein
MTGPEEERPYNPSHPPKNSWNHSELDIQIEIMRATGLEDDQILNLAKVRKEIEVGARDDLTKEYKGLAFVKYLRDNGRI